VPINLDQFTLWTATFEIRYDSAFLFWDRAGSVWAAVKNKYPEAAVDQANPNQARVIVDDKTQAVVGVDKTFFTVSKPKNDLRELQSLAEVIFPMVLERMEITSLTRVGLRVIYGKQFNSREEATTFLGQQVPLPKMTGKFLNVDGTVLEPEIYFLYEGDALAFSVRAKAQGTKLNITVPFEYQDLLKETKAERSTATLDIDYFAHATTPVTSFDAAALIESWLHLIRRDIQKVF
jgi:hypothetical protein